MLAASLDAVLKRIADAAALARREPPVLLAVSKTQSANAVAELAAAGQHAFGENYVQEAQAKIHELRHLQLEWHLIGHLQSNKAELAAELFDWVQSVDRPKLAAALAKHRSPRRVPLNVLIQVNVDDEGSKSGCAPDEVEALAATIAAEPTLRLRGLMAIPTPHADIELRRPAFVRMRELFARLKAQHPQVDTLSMGMSDDMAIAVAEGATMVRVGTALFGARTKKENMQ